MSIVSYDESINTLADFKAGVTAEIERRSEEASKAKERKRLAEAELAGAAEHLVTLRRELECSLRMLDQCNEMLHHFEMRNGRTSLEISVMDLAQRTSLTGQFEPGSVAA